MRNMAVLHSPAFSYPLPVLVRVLSNLLIFKGKILYYNKYNERWAQYQTKSLILGEGIAEPHPTLYKGSGFNVTAPIINHIYIRGFLRKYCSHVSPLQCDNGIKHTTHTIARNTNRMPRVPHCTNKGGFSPSNFLIFLLRNSTRVRLLHLWWFISVKNFQLPSSSWFLTRL